MRIILAVNNDLIGNRALNLFAEALHPDHELMVTVSSMQMRPSSESRPELDDIHAVESTFPIEQWFPMLEQANPKGDGQRYFSFNQLAAHYDIPLYFQPSIRKPEAVECFRAFAPDLIISVRYGAIFHAEHIAIPRYGVWNIHSGILPHYRGVMPSFRAMWQGNGEVGITLHSVPDATIDTGKIIADRRMPINPERSMLWHVWNLYPLALEMCLEKLTILYDRGSVGGTLQSEEGAQYFTFPTEQECREFTARGHQFYAMQEISEWLALYLPDKKQEMQEKVAA